MVDLAPCQYRQNFFYQGEKGGDFLSGFLKKYYPYLDEKKAFWLEGFCHAWAWLGGAEKPRRARGKEFCHNVLGQNIFPPLYPW